MKELIAGNENSRLKKMHLRLSITVISRYSKVLYQLSEEHLTLYWVYKNFTVPFMRAISKLSLMSRRMLDVA
jgi:hypothetical protein